MIVLTREVFMRKVVSVLGAVAVMIGAASLFSAETVRHGAGARADADDLRIAHLADPSGQAVRIVSVSAAGEEPDVEAVWIGATEWMSGVNWGGETYYGSVGKGVDFFSSNITAAGYVPVEVRFSSTPAEQTLCQTFTRPGYASAGVGTFPGSAWDMSNPGSPRRLNVCFVEWDDGAGPNPAPDLLWNPNDDGSLWGKREYLFVMKSSYDGTGLTYAGDNIFGDALDVLYAWWPIVTSGSTFLETEPATLEIKPYYVKNFYAAPAPTEIHLGWVFVGTAASTYEIYWGTSSPPTTLLGIVTDASVPPGGLPQYTHSGLTPGQNLYYRVDVYDGTHTLLGSSRELQTLTQTVANEVNLAGRWHGRGRYGDCWGYTDPGTGIEYALLCARNEGVSIIDIDADPPVEVGFIPSITPNTDMKDIKIYGQYAIALAEGEEIQIVDLSDVTTPVQVATIVPGGGGSHNCLVEGDYLYVIGNHSGGGLVIYDISTPSAPTYVGEYQPYYYHDIDIRNDTVYATGIYGDGIDIIDVSNKAAPTLISNFNYPGSGAHNAELTVDGKYVVIGDEIGVGNYARMFDVSDPLNVSKVADLIVDLDAVVHNCYIDDGELLFVAHYTEGLRVWNVADPTLPYEVAHYDTYIPAEYGYKGAWNVYPYFASKRIIVSDLQTGLYVFEMPGRPQCGCDCHGDPQCDAAPDVLDVVHAVDVGFRNAPDLTDPNPFCPRTTTDVDCDGDTDVLDVVHFVAVAFRNEDPAAHFCDPCAP